MASPTGKTAGADVDMITGADVDMVDGGAAVLEIATTPAPVQAAEVDDSGTKVSEPQTTAQPGGEESEPTSPHAKTVFVSYSERREHVSNKQGGRKTGGHVYQIKFFLVDTTGLEHLAAVGEDQGDAHYIYSNQPGFPGLYGHNKTDVKRWLEDVMAASQLRAGYHLDLVTDEVPADPSAIRLPTFVAYRQERREVPDGRHAMRWYLVDVFGKEHLAISGEERETRDGHYDYATQGVFHVVAPLSCHNQAAVVKWLDERVVHKGQAPGPHCGKRPGNLHALGRGGAGGGGGGGSSKVGRRGGTADSVQATALKKWRGGSGVGAPGPDPARDAREAVLAELRGAAGEESMARAGARRAALAWARDQPSAEAAAAADRTVALLGSAVADPEFLGLDGAGSEQQARNLAATVGALRALGHTYAPLALFAWPGLRAAMTAAVDRFQASHAELGMLACWVLRSWDVALGCHLAVLTQRRYASDPDAELEAALAQKGWLEGAVAGLTGAGDGGTSAIPPPGAPSGSRAAESNGAVPSTSTTPALISTAASADVEMTTGAEIMVSEPASAIATLDTERCEPTVAA